MTPPAAATLDSPVCGHFSAQSDLAGLVDAQAAATATWLAEHPDPASRVEAQANAVVAWLADHAEEWAASDDDRDALLRARPQ